MNYENILVEQRGALTLITLNRPKALNALNTSVLKELIDAFAAFGADDCQRCAVLTGSEKAFAAGADIKEMSDQGFASMYASNFFQGWEKVTATRKPWIAAVAGYALGGGCEVALACDVRVAARSAKLGQPEIKLGIIPGGGGTQRLPRMVGLGTAMRLILTGELIGAEEAARLELGVVLVDVHELRTRSYEIARAMAAHSPLTLRLAKAALRSSEEMPLGAGLAYERELFITAFGSNDKREGVAAFLEKRAAIFEGR